MNEQEKAQLKKEVMEELKADETLRALKELKNPTITKEYISSIKSTEERQALIKENLHLYEQ